MQYIKFQPSLEIRGVAFRTFGPQVSRDALSDVN